MFEVDKFMTKPFFDREPDPCKPHDKPHYTLTEEVEHSAKLMRSTVERLLRFEERVKSEIADLSKNITADNVIFKNTMHEAWTTFLMEVKNEINVFEGNVNADIQMFKSDIESTVKANLDTFVSKLATFEAAYEQEFTSLKNSIQEQYNSFVDAVNSRIDNYNENTAQAMADFQRQLTTQLNTFEQTMNNNYSTFTESVNNSIHEFREAWEQTMTERFAAQDGRISDAETYMKANLTATVTTLIGDMHANGEFTEIIEGEVFNDLQRKVDGFGRISILYFGAVGDGETDCTDAIETAIESRLPIYFPKGVYKVTANIATTLDNVELVGHKAIIDLSNHSFVIGHTTDNQICEGFHINGVSFKNGSVKLSKLKNFTIQNSIFEGGNYGIVGSHCYVGSIVGCQFNDNDYGIMFDKDIVSNNTNPDHNAIFIRDCSFYNNKYPFTIRGGFVGAFTGNRVEGNTNGIVIEGMSDYTIRNNYFEYNTGVIITLNTYKEMLNHAISIGQNRIFGNSSGTVTGVKLTGTIMGLVLDTNSWGGLGTLIDNKATLSGAILMCQVNNTGKSFPNFKANLSTIDRTVLLTGVTIEPAVEAGRMYNMDNSVHAHTKLGDYVLDYKLGYVPTLNTTPASGDGLLYLLPSGKLCIKVNGVEKTLAFTT